LLPGRGSILGQTAERTQPNILANSKQQTTETEAWPAEKPRENSTRRLEGPQLFQLGILPTLLGKNSKKKKKIGNETIEQSGACRTL